MIWIETLKLTSGYPFLSQMSMIVIFFPKMNKSLFGKRLASVCSVPVDDVPDGVSGKFLTHFSDFMKEIEWLKKLKQKSQ